MSKKNLMDLAQSVANTRQSQRAELAEGEAGLFSAKGLNTALNQAADPGKDRLSWIGKLKAQSHESKEMLETTRRVISDREESIRVLAKDSMKAQMKLLSAKLKQQFDTEFSVVAQQGLAIFAQAQRSFYAVVDAAVDLLADDLHQRVNELQSRWDSGRISELDFNNEMARIFRQRDSQVAAIEAACERRIRDLETTFSAN